ncbi:MULTISPECIES: nuclear transport factor 2 family protein [unclassified Streptomyces]|uniref:nuclear transport factor 2 family protein n=1 Tax=unclassified Streptomyces TaxID=2593676 RepID=UPI002E363F82|nr:MULTISPECIES: nuclear transport factor 2 family protein [unclassified Streptomyces]
MNEQRTRTSAVWRSRITGSALAAGLLIGGGAATVAFTSSSASATDQSRTSYPQLEAKVQRLDDIEDIRQLKSRYFRFVDEKNTDQLASLFTPHAKIVTDGTAFKSPRDFAKVIHDIIGAAPTAHSGYMPEITIAGPHTATGIWSMQDVMNIPAGTKGIEGHHGYGQYRETYEKVHGTWLISSVKLTRFWMEPLPAWTPPADQSAK